MRLQQVLVPQIQLPRRLQCQDIPRSLIDSLGKLASESQKESLSGVYLRIRLQHPPLQQLWARRRHHWWMPTRSQPQLEARRNRLHRQDLHFQPMSTSTWNSRVPSSVGAWVLILTPFWIKLMTTMKYFPQTMKKGCSNKVVFVNSNVDFGYKKFRSSFQKTTFIRVCTCFNALVEQSVISPLLLSSFALPSGFVQPNLYQYVSLRSKILLKFNNKNTLLQKTNSSRKLKNLILAGKKTNLG